MVWVPAVEVREAKAKRQDRRKVATKRSEDRWTDVPPVVGRRKKITNNVQLWTLIQKTGADKAGRADCRVSQNRKNTQKDRKKETSGGFRRIMSVSDSGVLNQGTLRQTSRGTPVNSERQGELSHATVEGELNRVRESSGRLTKVQEGTCFNFTAGLKKGAKKKKPKGL